MAHRIEAALGDTVDNYFKDSQMALKRVPLRDYGVPNYQVQSPSIRHAQPPTVQPPSPNYQVTETQLDATVEWPPGHEVRKASRSYSHQPTPSHFVQQPELNARRRSLRPPYDDTEAQRRSRPTQIVWPQSPDHQAMGAETPIQHSQAPTVHVGPSSPDHPVTKAQQPPVRSTITRTTSTGRQ
jgi:hypothetical protein